MKKIRNFIYKRRMICLILVLFVFLFYLSYSLYKKEDLWAVEKIFKNMLTNITSVVTPRIDVNYQEVVDGFTKEKEEELASLRRLLDLKNQSSFELEHASILNRNVLSYFDEFTIDKGKANGIDQGMLAICEKGLIGVVLYVTQNTATIKLITSENNPFKIAVSVVNGENIYNGIVTGYNHITGEIIVESIRNQSNIEVGNVVKTNGLGNLYPGGISIGNVSSIKMDEVGVSKILSIKSEVDFRNIKYVSIVKGVKS